MPISWGWKTSAHYVLQHLASLIVDGIWLVLFVFFLNCYLAAPPPTLGHYRGGSLTHPMLITCVLHIQPKGHQEPCNEVGSLSSAEHLVGFKPGTFRFWSQCLNPLCHSPQMSVMVDEKCKNLKKCLLCNKITVTFQFIECCIDDFHYILKSSKRFI